MDYRLEKLAKSIDMAIYDAAYWLDVCDEGARLFDAAGTILIPFDAGFRGPWLPRSATLEDITRQYLNDGWHLRDERQKLTDLILRDRVVTEDDYADRAELLKTPYYKELLIPHGFGFFIGILIDTPKGPWCFSVQLEHDRPPISDEERALAMTVSEMLSEASAKALEIAEQRLHDFARLMSETVTHVYVLDPFGDVTLTFGPDGESSAGGPADIRSALHKEDLDDVLALCTSDPKSRRTIEKTVQIGGHDYRLSAMQIPTSLRHFHMAAKIVVYLSEVVTSRDSLRRRHKRLFGITNAEFDAIEMLSRGSRIAEIAELTGLKESTIRQRLKVAYQKMDVSTQSQLVAKFKDVEQGGT